MRGGILVLALSFIENEREAAVARLMKIRKM